MSEEQIRQIVKDELQEFLASDRYIFSKLIQFLDGRNVQFGLTTGTKFGTSALQKVAFHGATPVIQGSAITNVSGGATQDAEARTAVNAILSRLRNKGFIAT